MENSRTGRHFLLKELAEIINRNSIDAKMNMPDYVISEMILQFLETVSAANKTAENHKKK